MFEQVESLLIWIPMVYFGNLFNILVLKNVFQDPITFFTFILPILIMFLTEIPAKISLYISHNLYTFLFTLSAIVIAFTLTMTLSSALYVTISIFISLNKTIAIFLTIILPFIYTIYGIYIQSYTIVQTLNFKNRNIKENIKIAHLTDLHLGGVFQKNLVNRVVGILEKMNPDIILITGDLADGSMEINPDWLTPFNRISSNIPILFITGNHEEIHGTSKLLNILKINNRIKHIGSSLIKFKGYSFIGVDYEDNLKSKLKEILAENRNNENLISNNEVKILFHHIPELLPEELKKYGIFLYLCGHTHGGQTPPITFPTYFSNILFSGLYNSKDNENHVYVCPGIGSAIVPMRTFCRSVIGEINIRKE